MSRNRRPLNRIRSRETRELAAPVATIEAPTTNGNGNGVGPPADVMRQVSFSGTPSYAGMTRPDDYVSELQEPVRRMQTFEEMRFSDDAVHGALSAREHMIQSSNWALQPPDDSAGSRTILEFAEDNLYPFLDDILGKMSGALQYGFSAIEPVLWLERQPHGTQLHQGRRSPGCAQVGPQDIPAKDCQPVTANHLHLSHQRLW
jgi:hypothetical protein